MGSLSLRKEVRKPEAERDMNALLRIYQLSFGYGHTIDEI